MNLSIKTRKKMTYGYLFFDGTEEVSVSSMRKKQKHHTLSKMLCL